MAVKTLADGHQRVVILAARPADPEAPTVTELNAGIDASCRLLKSDYRISAAASDTIADAELCSTTNAQAFGAGNYEATFTSFRYFDPTNPGKYDPQGDEVFQALKEKGAGDILVICGGVIPHQDYAFLKEAGVKAIFGPGTNIPAAASEILGLIRKTEG